jgi:hypothetical protein
MIPALQDEPSALHYIAIFSSSVLRLGHSAPGPYASSSASTKTEPFAVVDHAACATLANRAQSSWSLQARYTANTGPEEVREERDRGEGDKEEETDTRETERR